MTRELVVSSAALAGDPFGHARYVIKRPFWSFGRRFHVYGPSGMLVMFVRHPLLKLHEEFTLFTDETERTPLLTIRARSVVALNMAHDVVDARTGERAGTLRARGLASLVRDTWDILDGDDRPIGLVREDGASLLRRFFPILTTSKHHIELDGAKVATLRQVFRLFGKEFVLDLDASRGRIDPRFAVACALLALMAETRREERR